MRYPEELGMVEQIYPFKPLMTATETFYNSVKHLVLAQTEGEIGNPEVETMLKRMASWSLKKFSAHMSVTCVCWGHVIFEFTDDSCP